MKVSKKKIIVSKKYRILYFIIGLFFLIILSLFILVKVLKDAYGIECKKIEEKEISNYKIVKLECLGWAGPYYFKRKIYKFGEEISSAYIQEDSCRSYFSIENKKIQIFNFCDNTIREKYPTKNLIDISDIDSMKVLNSSSLKEIKLSKKEITDFSSRWNLANLECARGINQNFYPKTKYKIKIFQKANVREFNTSDISIQEKNSFWCYNFLEEGEPRTTRKFDKIFQIE